MECRVEFDYNPQEEDELTLKKGDIITGVVQKMEGWWEGTLGGRTGMFPDNFVKVVETRSNASISIPPPQVPIMEKAKTDVVVRNKSPAASVRRLRALFSYAPDQEDELKLEVGDIIEYIGEVEEGWWTGKLKGKTGIFPSNFVSDADAPVTAANATPPSKKMDTEIKQKDPPKLPTSNIPHVSEVVPPPVPPTEPPPLDDDEPPLLPPKPVRELARCFYPYQAQNEDELALTEGDIVVILSKTCEDEGWWRGELRGKSGLFPDNFVKIVSSNEAQNANKIQQPSMMTQGPKLSPQERNLSGVTPLYTNTTAQAAPVLTRNGPSTGVEKSSTIQKDDVDTVPSNARTKNFENVEESVSSKVARFSQLNLIPRVMNVKPSNLPSPLSGGGGVSPVSLPANLNPVRREPKDDGEFNDVERGEKLQHLTAGRAKAPRRRPPSSIMTKDGEENGLTNGNYGSQESIESPTGPVHSSFNSSTDSYTTAANSTLDGSHVSENGNVEHTPTGSSVKPKVVAPWMAELKQKQDKKQTSPALASTSPSSPSSPPILPPLTTPVQTKEKEAKAPPLPAKPNSLATTILGPSVDKSPAVSPSYGNSTVANKPFAKKPPMPVSNTNHHNNFSTPEGTVGGGGGDTKNYASYEEHSKLRDKVLVLETEVETLRRQVKLLLDRELSHGQIV